MERAAQIFSHLLSQENPAATVKAHRVGGVNGVDRVKGVALVVGAGSGIGGAVARRFAADGYTVCVVRRRLESLDRLVKDIKAEFPSVDVHPFGCDARNEEQVEALVADIEDRIGPLRFVCFNIGANVRFSVLDTTARVYRKVWEMASLAGFLVGRAVAARLVARGEGTIVFTGATASMRGANGFSAFSGGKASLRMLAQSMARELGPKGVHVAHVVVDGAVDSQFIRERFPLLLKRGPDSLVDPRAIADMYAFLHQQPRCAWTHEMDVRPSVEPW